MSATILLTQMIHSLISQLKFKAKTAVRLTLKRLTTVSLGYPKVEFS